MNETFNFWIGKEVRIYPNDTHYKFGKIIYMNDFGVTFLITEAQKESGYLVGKYQFISYSANLTFQEKNH